MDACIRPYSFQKSLATVKENTKACQSYFWGKQENAKILEEMHQAGKRLISM